MMASGLLAGHDLLEINVQGSHQISTRVTFVLSNLAQSNEKVVALTAQSTAINKLISIVEIVKRQRKSESTSTFQYNALSTKLIDIPRPKQDDTDPKEGNISDAASEDFDNGEISQTKKRSVPVMTVYLANQSLKDLRQQYG